MISIIIPIYNAEKYLEKCLDSCVNQRYKDIEIIAINDGCSDGSLEIIQRYAQKDHRIVLFSQNNQGLVKARIAGIKQSKGEYIFFLDSDDVLPLQALNDLVQDSTDADLIIGNIDIMQQNGKLIRCIRNRLSFGQDVIGVLCALISKQIVGSLSGRLIRKELFLRSNIEHHFTIGEDVITNIQICRLPVKIKLVDKSVYNYIQHPESMLNKVGEAKSNARLAYIQYVINFAEQYGEKQQIQDCVAMFALEEYYSYLRDGGKKENCKWLVDQINNKYLHNTWAIQNITSWRLLMIKLDQKSPLLCKLYKFILVSIRQMIR